jgi:hypothetical protein
VNLSDGLLYDFLIIIGLPLFIYFLYRGLQICKDLKNNKTIISLLVIIIFGIFEGLLNKLTPIGVGIAHILFTNKNDRIIYNTDLSYNKYNIYFVKTISIAGLFVLLFSWNATVFESKIYSNPQLSYDLVHGPMNSVNDCDKADVIFSPQIVDKSAFISIKTTNKNLLEKCKNSISSLLSKDFDDEKHTKPIPQIFSVTNEIEKDNFFLYFLAFLLLINGFIFAKKISVFG